MGNIKKFTLIDRKVIKYIKNYYNKNIIKIPIKIIVKNLNINQENILKSIEKLKYYYNLEIEKSNIIFQNTTLDRIIPTEFDNNLNYINADSYYFESINSTNTFLKELILQNKVKTGSVAVTEHQTKGAGQQNKIWIDKAFASILMSLYIKPELNIENILLLTGTIGLAVSETIEKICPLLYPKIKWPNDIFIGNKKCAGILTNGSIINNKFEYAIIGIGLDVNYEIEDFPPDIRNIATSLQIETKTIYNRMKILNELIKNIDNQITLLFNGKTEDISKKINEKLYHKNNKIIYKKEKYIINGINNNGELILNKVCNNEITNEILKINSAGDFNYDYGD